MKSLLHQSINNLAAITLSLIIAGAAALYPALTTAQTAADDAPAYDELKLEGAILGTIQQKDTVLNEQPLHATVKLYDENYQLVAQTETEAEGNYTLFLEPNTKYQLLIEKSGYVTRKFKINTSTAFNQGREEMDVYMAVASQFNVTRNQYKNKVVAYGGESNYLERGEIIDWVEFRIQVGRYAKPINAAYFSKIEDVKMMNDGKTIIYTAGAFKNLDEAKAYLKTVQEKGYEDAFLTAYDLEQNRLPAKEAAAAIMK